MAVAPEAIGNEMSLWMAGKEQQLSENSECLPNVSVAEGVREIADAEPISGRSGEKDSLSGTLRTGLLYKMDTKKWDRWEQECEHSREPASKQDEQEVGAVCEAPRVSSLLQLSEESTPTLAPESSVLTLSYWNAKMGLQMKELGANHADWLEKINNIMQKISNTESTVKSLLTEVISLENQSENLEDPDQEAHIEEKIAEIRKQLKEMNIKLAQVDACNEARGLKEQLIDRVESFHREMDVLNTQLEMYHRQEREPGSHSSEDAAVEQAEALLPEASPAPSGSRPPACTAVWKLALRLLLALYVVAVAALACYVLLVDATFVFERLLPGVLGHRAMWELREVMAPFLHLEAEALLPS
nr:single-pass membrane and coiled-coil domain-containing protein 2 [Meriones unguiculatus]